MKKRFKRLGAMLLAGTMLLGATACGGGSNSSTTGNAAKSEDSASTTETGGTTSSGDIVDCQHFFRQIFLGYFSDIVQAFDTLRKNVCGDDYTSLHNPIVLSSVLPAYGMFHSIQILFL